MDNSVELSQEIRGNSNAIKARLKGIERAQAEILRPEVQKHPSRVRLLLADMERWCEEICLIAATLENSIAEHRAAVRD